MRRTLLLIVASLFGCVLFLATANAEDAPFKKNVSSPSSPEKEGTKPLTLEEAFAWAERESPAIKALEFDTAWAKARVDGAGAHPNPEIELGIEDIQPRRRPGENAFEAYSVAVSQPFEWLGKRSARRALAESEVRGRELESAKKRAQYRLSIAEIIVKCAQWQRLTVLSRERLVLAQRLSSIASDRVKAGKISALEESQLVSSMLLARAESEEHALELVSARAELAALLGTTADSFGEVSFNLESLPSEPPSPLTQNASPSISMLKADNEIEEARARLSLERHSVVPDLTISAEMTLPRSPARPLFSVGVGMPLPLFDRNQGARGEALANAEAAPLLAQSERNDHMRERAQTRAELTSALQKVRVLKEGALDVLQRNQTALEDAYAQGRLGYLDVVTNQESLSSMREKYIEALAQAHASSFRLTALIATKESPTSETLVPPDVRIRP
jgi:cobalt-zinc-cadmium efflux system outer membrane protein